MIGSTNAVEDINIKSSINYVEYIESTGTQYINTGFKHNQNTRFVMDCQIDKFVGWKNFFGSFGGTRGTQKFMFLGMHDSTKKYYGAFGTSDNSYITPYIGRQTIDFNKNILKINDASHTFAQNTFQSSYNDLIFSVTSYDGTDESSNRIEMKLYSFKIYDGDILIRDLKPILDENNVACLYDEVSKTCFYNVGTGTFNAGPII